MASAWNGMSRTVTCFARLTGSSTFRRSGRISSRTTARRAAFDRSRADDAHADRRLLLRHSLGAAAVRGGPPQSGLSLVLSLGARRRRSRSFDVFQEPPRPFPRERSVAQAVRDRGGALHEGRDRGRRGLRSRRQHDRGRRASTARRRQGRGSRSDVQPRGRRISFGSR